MHFCEVKRKKYGIAIIGWTNTYTHKYRHAINLFRTSFWMQIKPLTHFCSQRSFDVDTKRLKKRESNAFFRLKIRLNFVHLLRNEERIINNLNFIYSNVLAIRLQASGCFVISLVTLVNLNYSSIIHIEYMSVHRGLRWANNYHCPRKSVWTGL